MLCFAFSSRQSSRTAHSLRFAFDVDDKNVLLVAPTNSTSVVLLVDADFVLLESNFIRVGIAACLDISQLFSQCDDFSVGEIRRVATAQRFPAEKSLLNFDSRSLRLSHVPDKFVLIDGKPVRDLNGAESDGHELAVCLSRN